MQTKNVVQVCEDYGVNPQDLRTACMVELTMMGKINTVTSQNLEPVVKEFEHMLGEAGMINAVRWATWVKNARDNMNQAIGYPELLKVCKAVEKE